MKVNCEHCGKKFHKWKAEIKRTNHNFCSKHCKSKYYANGTDVFDDKYEIDDNGCMNFTGHLNNSGYETVRYDGIVFLAHRLSYLLAYGDIPKRRNVLHKCDNPKCINPKYLFVGMHKDNMQDMLKKERWIAKLSNENVRFIRNSKLLSNNKLAKMFNVSERTIRYAKQKGKWQSAG